MQNLAPSPRPLPEFTPVPRKYRFDGWTNERQRAFIAALAETGSVRSACKRINMSTVGAYDLRRQPEAESFAAAWEAALAHGVQNIADIALERAIEGVPVPIFYKGEQCGEKRWYNDRLIMFILRHYMPDRFGKAALAAGTRSPETVAREAAQNCPVCRERNEGWQRGQALTPEQAERGSEWLDKILKRYDAKVRTERWHRLRGETLAADFALRQLTHIELILDCGGLGIELIKRYTTREDPNEHGPVQIFASPLSRTLDDQRRAVWGELGEPARPPLTFYDRLPSGRIMPSETSAEREAARTAAEQRIAQAQLEWEAAAREDSWAEWKAKHSGDDHSQA
jgi:hypothetical protein